MKLITYTRSGQEQSLVGALLEDLKTIVDLSSAFPDMMSLVEGGQAALEQAAAMVAAREITWPLDRIRLKAPLPEPKQIRDCMCFEKHVWQAQSQFVRMKLGPLAGLVNRLKLIRIPKVWYQQPIYYKANRFSVVGPEQDIIWPSYSRLMDFECEMGVVIGRKGVNIRRNEAHEYIFGYTIFNDMSARDAQFKEMAGRLGPAKGKDFDTGNAMGPWLVTKDELTDPYNLIMISRVNGEEWGRGNSGDMHHKFEDIIAHVSLGETLYPGEFIGGGTVGDGCGLEHGRFLKPGDVIELEITGLGILRNRLIMNRDQA